MSDLVPAPPDAALDEAVAALRSFMLATQEFRQTLAARMGLTFTDTVAMSYLAAEGQLSAGELAERLGLAASSVTALLDRLEAADLVSRGRSPDDRRAVTVAVTESGVTAHAVARQWMQSALRDLGDDVPVAAKIMERLAESLRAQVRDVGATSSTESPADGRPAVLQ